jgi:hypothetical protein
MKKNKPIADPTVIFIKPWVYVRSQGDGSANVLFFNTEAEAEAFTEGDEERLCDDVFQVTLVIDPRTGQICNVRKRKDDE